MSALGGGHSPMLRSNVEMKKKEEKAPGPRRVHRGQIEDANHQEEGLGHPLSAFLRRTYSFQQMQYFLIPKLGLGTISRDLLAFKLFCIAATRYKPCRQLHKLP